MNIEEWHRTNRPGMGLGQLKYSTHLLPDKSCLYVETPKAACSTIKATLPAVATGGMKADHSGRNFLRLHQRKHSPLLSLGAVTDVAEFLTNPDVFKFCFVRKPATRLLSAYRDKITVPTSRPKGELLKWLGKDPLSAEDISLETFLSCISEHPPKHMNPHWRVQYYQTMQGLIDYQFIGRFEAIEDDLRKTLHTINADGVSGIVDVRPHATNASKINLMDISSEARTLIYSIYEIDYDFFKY